MALTITPAVSGASQRRGIVHVLLYIAGLFSGAVVTCALFRFGLREAGAQLPRAAIIGIITALVVAGIMRDLGLRIYSPYLEKQVPEWLRSMVPMGTTAYAYGGILGLGFVTRYTYAAHAAMVVGLSQLPLSQMLIGCAIFAGFKAIGLLATPWRSPKRGVGDSFDRRFFFRAYGRFALRTINVIAALVGLILAITSAT